MMTAEIASQIAVELSARGFAANGDAPHQGMILSVDWLLDWDLIELLDFLIVRREKIFRSGLGPELSRPHYDDVVLAIEAVKAVMGRHLS